MELKTIGTKVKCLFDGGEERGVSPVIGVILMVAITVILAAVIGAFVLQLGDGMDAGQIPTASVSGDVQDYDTGETTTEGDPIMIENAVFTHQTGDTMASEDIRIVYGGNRYELSSEYGDSFGSGSTINVMTNGGTIEGGTETADLSSYSGSVSLVYDDGSESTTLATVEVDNAA